MGRRPQNRLLGHARFAPGGPEPGLERSRHLVTRHRRLLRPPTVTRTLHSLGTVRHALATDTRTRHHAARTLGVWRTGTHHLSSLRQATHAPQSLPVHDGLGNAHARSAYATPTRA